MGFWQLGGNGSEEDVLGEQGHANVHRADSRAEEAGQGREVSVEVQNHFGDSGECNQGVCGGIDTEDDMEGGGSR